MGDTSDIVSVINSYAPLEQKGRIYRGYCPFCNSHDEKLVVRPEVGEWHCFQCGAGGNAEDFVALFEGTVLHKYDYSVPDNLPVEPASAPASTIDMAAETAADEEPLAGFDEAFKQYFARLKKVTGYKAAVILDGNNQIIGMDQADDSNVDLERLNNLFISIIDLALSVYGESLSAKDTEFLFTAEEGVVLYLSLHFREEPVHVIILGSDKGQQYLMRMHASALGKL